MKSTRVERNGMDMHENMDRDCSAYFGDLADIMYVEKDCHWILENLATGNWNGWQWNMLCCHRHYFCSSEKEN